MAPPASHSHRQLDVFPPEVVLRIAAFLLGVDVVHFSHASPMLFDALNAPDVWRGRIDDPQTLQAYPPGASSEVPAWYCHEKAMYLRQRAVRLRGASDPGWRNRWPRCGDCVALPFMLFARTPQFRLEVTFSVSSASARHGGVLVGFQDVDCLGSTPLTHLVRPVVLVAIDAHGGLHVTPNHVAGSTTPASANVTYDQWHRLVVSFNDDHVSVDLDGQQCFLRARRGFRWGAPMHGQIGTGVQRQLGPLPLDSTDPELIAWRPLHGLVAEARVLRPERNEHDAPDCVSDLIHGEPDPHETRVVSSRPCERYAQVLPREHHTK